MLRLKYYIKRIHSKVFKQIRSRLDPFSVHAYWWNGDINFGDLITPFILKNYGYNPFFSLPHDADIIAVGSILEHLPDKYNGKIIGTGFLYEKSSAVFPQADIISLRGNLSKERIKNAKPEFLGDAGLLIGRLVKKQKKTHTLGIISHFLDVNNLWINSFYGKYKKDILLINPQQETEVVVNSIDKCEYMLSSSLHGLIVADSLNIPNIWFSPKDKIFGGDFKYLDYFSSIEREPKVYTSDPTDTLCHILSKASKPNMNIINEIQEQLDRTFKLIKKNENII